MDIDKPRKPRAPRKSKAATAGEVTEDMNTETVDSGAAPAAMDTVVAANAAAAPAAAVNPILHLGAGLEIKDVESVHKQLVGMLDQGAAVTVDISHVAAMDTAGVQLLLAFQSEAAKRGTAIDYTGRSNAFTHALTAVGLVDAVRHVVSRD